MCCQIQWSNTAKKASMLNETPAAGARAGVVGAWAEALALSWGCPSGLGWDKAFSGEIGLTPISRVGGPDPDFVALLKMLRSQGLASWVITRRLRTLDCLCC